MAQAQDLARDTPFLGKPAHLRLGGPAVGGGPTGLAPFNAVLAAGSTNKIRLRVRGAQQVLARAKGTIVGAGAVTLQVYPMLADAQQDDTKGTRSGFRDDGTAVPAAAALANNVEAVVRLPLNGVDYVEVEIVVAAATTWDPTTAGSFLDVAVN
jgi:hypothetical protein